uniref:RING-type domain-containing protein n=1 Tax=Chenopodium quinoa TaxID=63459 RepID=A0A803LGV9_CHEQI
MEENNNATNDEQKPVDDVFTVHLSYYEDGLNDVPTKNVSFEFARESPCLNWERKDAVMNCLKDNDINVDDSDSILNVVVQSCDLLLDYVRNFGRKSLVMYVKVIVYHVNDEQEDGDDHEYDYDDELMEEEEEPMFLDDDIVDNEEIIEFRLEASGVRFSNGYSGAKENCTICLEEFGKSDNVAMLPCSHVLLNMIIPDPRYWEAPS